MEQPVFIKSKNIIKNKEGPVWWLMPVIRSSQEVKIGKHHCEKLTGAKS
jgi:hypothetical protein